MTRKYVDSAAGGANNGTSWTDAWTSFDNVTGLSAGDDIAVDDGHLDSFTASKSYDWSTLGGTLNNPIKIICRDKADDSLSTGAIIRATNNANDIDWLGNHYTRGITFEPGQYNNLSTNAADQKGVFDSCTFTAYSGSTNNLRTTRMGNVSGDNVSDVIELDFISCTFTCNDTIFLNSGLDAKIRNSTFNFATDSGFDLSNFQGGEVLIESCNLAGSSTPTTLVTFDTSNGGVSLLHIKNCKLPAASITTANGSSSSHQQLLVENSDNGTITDPALGLNYYECPLGTVTGVLDHYMTGGADDGEQANAYSWRVEANSNAKSVILPLRTPDIVKWVDGGSSVTATLNFATNPESKNDDIWVEWEYPDTAGSAKSKNIYDFSSRLADPNGTAASHTSTTSQWNGGLAVADERKHSITFTPTNAGWIIARFCSCTINDVYVNPEIVIT